MVSVRFLAAATAAIIWVVTAGAGPAWAQDVEEPDIEVFEPLVTRTPMPEREVEISVGYEKGREGRELETELELSWRFGQQFSLSLEVPIVYLEPRESPDVVGIGDIALDARFRVFQSVQHAALVSLGVELGLPTGSEDRGLGGSTAVTPYVAAGIGLGPIDLVGEVNYSWIVDGADSGIQSLGVNLAVGYVGWRRVVPFVELNVVTQTRSGGRGGDRRGGDRGVEDEGDGEVEEDQEVEDDEPDLVGRPQVYLTPGVRFDFRRGLSMRVGVQFPVTSAKEFDYRVLAAFNWEF